MSVRADADTLQRIPLFSDCGSVPLQVIAFAAERQQVEPGQSIIVEGDRGLSAFLILNGRADIRLTVKSQEVSLGHADPGALLGEIAMLGMGPYAVSAIAATLVVAARIDRTLFMRVADAYPDFGDAVFKALGRKLDASLQDLNTVRGFLDNARSFSRRL